MNITDIQSYKSFDDILENSKTEDFPSTFGNKSYIDRYRELKNKFAHFPVELGAMNNSIKQWIVHIQGETNKINEISDKSMREKALNDLFDDDPIILLNRHDFVHTNKVMEKALDIVKCFDKAELSYYEIYFLSCAIVVHDIGNVFGRVEHEKKILDILESDSCKSIVPDIVERRTISRISGVHGGKIYGSLDTISALKETATVNGFDIREQLLAAILRFADELADDVTRANYDALESEIIGPASEIYHIYSEKLHTVALKKNNINNTYEVFLAYQFDSDTAQKQYGKACQKKYLIDEIYSRTIKMERERRYCIRYLRPYCSLERINVQIIITKNAFDEEKISYKLEERGYPDSPFVSIKNVQGNLLSGAELAAKLGGEL